MITITKNDTWSVNNYYIYYFLMREVDATTKLYFLPIRWNMIMRKFLLADYINERLRLDIIANNHI